MTRTICAIALALGMFAALSTPSHAALSTAERTPVTLTLKGGLEIKTTLA